MDVSSLRDPSAQLCAGSRKVFPAAVLGVRGRGVRMAGAAGGTHKNASFSRDSFSGSSSLSWLFPE